ncbi:MULTISPECIES: hypothetical protein [Xanthomonas]|uniref:Uncharacterized protein n=2 Tax=Xanthomonas TaxID=338 RepID=A0A7Z7IYH4_XANCH|nr:MULTISPECIES: hypothetical protein [Xanthomonas]ATS39279.1 hypothetical protein XcfCFBP6988P_15055 [Xanthomonas citri pv. phaseoli var. fuscans]ATS41914.1 hypothetical protein XcfCFBP6989P_05435 [Xanthomonas citri pv. phaseoli var. fuscans]ATS47282.1 hypothetical protein XcfCFBP6990P_11925 [Xanthomonas citri pv. phaseoli var. fuscans]ATS86339.1 hypothetical protein XcfCFBP6991P_22305 [Xanthomonas citri pv. phaseoli var. fuscans]QWN20923.1 hypothetical protein DGM98_12990 [Xanthomonas citri]
MDEFTQDLILDLRAELLAQDLLLKAVISTMPRRAEVHAAFQVVIAHHESLALDHAMDGGLSAEDAGQMRALLRRKTDLLLAFLQGS